VLHLTQWDRKWCPFFEVFEQKHSIYFSVSSLSLFNEDSVVSSAQVWLVLGNLVFELAEHDLLLVLKLLLFLLTGEPIRRDRPLELEFDMSDHLSTLRVVYRQSDHSLSVLMRPWREQLPLYLGLALAQQAESARDFALRFYCDGCLANRV